MRTEFDQLAPVGNCWAAYIEVLRCTISTTTRQVQLAIVKSLLTVVSRMSEDFYREFIKVVHKILTVSLDVANYSSLRIEALKVLIALLKKMNELQMTDLMEDVRQVYYLRVDEAMRDSSPEVKSRADEARQLLMN